jgi:hypothetical protein
MVLKMMQVLCAFLLIISSAFAACEDYKKIHGLIHLKKKTWETTHVNKKYVNICDALPSPQNANIEISLSKGKMIFSTRIYRPLLGFWDETLDKEGASLNGGTYDITHLNIDIFVPKWYKGAKITVKDMVNDKIIIESKL